MTDQILVQCLTANATLPARAHPLDAGLDLSSAADVVIESRGHALVPTDIAVALPAGTYGRVAPRSGLTLEHGLDVGAGVVDCTYRDALGVILFNHTELNYYVAQGDCIAQLIIERIANLEPVQVSRLPGSTCSGRGN